jgi:hypothetical protein
LKKKKFAKFCFPGNAQDGMDDPMDGSYGAGQQGHQKKRLKKMGGRQVGKPDLMESVSTFIRQKSLQLYARNLCTRTVTFEQGITHRLIN